MNASNRDEGRDLQRDEDLALLSPTGVSELSDVAPAHESNTMDRIFPLGILDNSAVSPLLTFKPGDRVGDFEVLGLLGQGGMGVVYKAHHTKLSRLVALKILINWSVADAPRRQRFKNEASAAAGLKHPNILPIHDIGEHEGCPFLVLEFAENGSLAQQLVGKPQPPKDAAKLVETLARAVQVLHDHDIIHRDLKPSNVLLTTDGTAKISDFGLAKLLDAGPGDTLSGDIVGTPSYMAPEQAKGDSKRVGRSADVYALGAILYEVITGRPPFQAPTPQETRELVLSHAPVPPRSLQPKLPRDLETICLKCLEKEPRDRYPSAESLAADLKRYTEDRPIEARPIPPWVRGWRWCRRKPGLAALWAAFIVSLLGGTIASTWFGMNERFHAGVARNQTRIANRKTAEADRRLDQTMQAIEDYYTGVAEEVLLQAEFPDLFRRSLAKPREFYEQLARELDQATTRDERAQYLLVKGRFGLGRISQLLGQYDEGRQQFEAALGLTLVLLANKPGDPNYQRALAWAYGGLGTSQRSTGDLRGAADSRHQEIATYAKLVSIYPYVPEHQLGLAGAYTSLGNLRRDSGDLRGAAESHRQAIATTTKLVADHPAIPRYENELASDVMHLGTVQKEMGQLREAEVSHRRVVELRTKLVAAQPDVTEYQYKLAGACLNLGSLQKSTGDQIGAEQSVRQAFHTLTRLTSAQPNVVAYQDSLGMAANNLSNLQVKAGDQVGAIDSFQQAITTYSRLATMRPDVPAYQDGLARAYTGLGNVQFGSDNPGGAVVSLRGATKVYTKLVSAHPNIPAYQDGLASAYNSLGAVEQQTGNLTAATGSFGLAVATYKKLASALPNVPEYRYRLTAAYTNLGSVQEDTGDLHGAALSYREAITAFTTLVSSYPTVLNYQDGLATAYSNLGLVQRSAGNLQGALESLRQAVAMGAKLTSGHPAVPGYLDTLAMATTNLGMVQDDMGDSSGASLSFRQTIAIYTKLVSVQPSVPEHHSRLGGSYMKLGVVQHKTSDLVGAAASYHEAIRYARYAYSHAQSVIEFQRTLSLAYSNFAALERARSRPLEAVGATTERRELWPNDPAELYAAACEIALCMPMVSKQVVGGKLQKDELAAEAVATLRQAIAAGWKDWSHAANNPDLKPLYQHHDFQELIFDRLFPADPFRRDQKRR